MPHFGYLIVELSEPSDFGNEQNSYLNALHEKYESLSGYCIYPGTKHVQNDYSKIWSENLKTSWSSI